jgi:hypothetical protein
VIKNVGEHELTILLAEQGRVVLREGDQVALEIDDRGAFTRAAKIYGSKKVRRRLVRQLRRGERRLRRMLRGGAS